MPPSTAAGTPGRCIKNPRKQRLPSEPGKGNLPLPFLEIVWYFLSGNFEQRSILVDLCQ
jgi:hypothetical protein